MSATTSIPATESASPTRPSPALLAGTKRQPTSREVLLSYEPGQTYLFAPMELLSDERGVWGLRVIGKHPVKGLLRANRCGGARVLRKLAQSASVELKVIGVNEEMSRLDLKLDTPSTGEKQRSRRSQKARTSQSGKGRARLIKTDASAQPARRTKQLPLWYRLALEADLQADL